MVQENRDVFTDEGHFQMAVASPLDAARWIAIRDRLIDELAKGGRLEDFAPDGIGPERLGVWLKAPAFGEVAWRRVGQKSTSEQIADALESRFAEIDQAGFDYRSRCPARVETAVTRAFFEGAETARELCEWVDFCAAPGLGKTEAKNDYIARSRKVDGFFCPVWSIDLDETCATPRAVLALIAREILGGGKVDEKNEFATARAIIEATRDKRGLLIVDEGQHLADATKKLGIPVVNQLRSFVDRGCFGLVYLGNGEIYRRLSTGQGRDKGAYTQLLSRMQDFRIEVGGYRPGASGEGWRLTRDDVLAVASAWGVSGVEEAAYCLKIAEGPGALRAMTNVFRMALGRYGLIDIKTLNKVKAI